jgi:lysine 2,3-aminomutase
MSTIAELDRIAITVKSHRLLHRLLAENPKLEEIMRKAMNETEALVGVRNWVLDEIRDRPGALAFYASEHPDRKDFQVLEWRDFAAIRILDYIDNAGREFQDLNLRGELAVSNPFQLLWLAVHHGTGGAKPGFFEDMLHLFRQFTGANGRARPSRGQVEAWMERYPSGLDPRIVKLREENRDRILGLIIDRMDRGEIHSERFQFEPPLPGPGRGYPVLREPLLPLSPPRPGPLLRHRSRPGHPVLCHLQHSAGGGVRPHRGLGKGRPGGAGKTQRSRLAAATLRQCPSAIP